METCSCICTERVPDHIRLTMEAIMAAPDGSKKAGIYHILYQINAAFCALVGHYRELRRTGVLSAKFTRRYEGFTRELQAEFNQDFLLPLHGIELEDWARFGKVREQWEKRLKDPNDAALEAAGHKRKSRREKKRSLTKSRAPQNIIESK